MFLCYEVTLFLPLSSHHPDICLGGYVPPEHFTQLLGIEEVKYPLGIL